MMNEYSKAKVFRAGIIIFGVISFVFFVLHYKGECGELVYSPFAGLFFIFTCFWLGKLQAIKFKDNPSKLKKLRYGYFFLIIAIVADIYLFWSAFRVGVY